MRHQGWPDHEVIRVHTTLAILVFVAVLVGLGAAAWFTKSVHFMPPAPGSLAEPPSPNELPSPPER